MSLGAIKQLLLSTHMSSDKLNNPKCLHMNIKSNFYEQPVLRVMTFILVLSLYSSYALGDKITIAGLVKDKATSTDLYGAVARLLNAADSSLVEEVKAERRWKSGSTGNWTEYQEPRFTLYQVADRDKKYIIQLIRENYDTLYYDFDPAVVSKRADSYDVGKLFMKRKVVALNEFTVKATKVKFYNRGDTLVYNADAFNLAEGSMLDALIKQLPGAELKDDGRIFVNGRFVENLLLNGKDFFKGNNQIMLENLGAYTVKQIEVYERQNDMNKLMGKDYGQKTYSMDVRLKKEYSQGFLSNIEAGYGTENRYLGRLFALWYADHARIGLYGNANNLSNRSKPGQDNSFAPAWMNSGEFNKVMGGLDYNADMPVKGVAFSGNAAYDYTKTISDRHVYRTNFLTGGDTYDYQFNRGTNRNWSVSTAHTVKFTKDQWNLQINPSFSYTRQNNWNDNTAASFTKDFQDVSREFIYNIFSNGSADVLASLINRSLSMTRLKGHTANGAISLNGKRKTNQTDAISWSAGGNYTGRALDKNEDFAINFGDNPTPKDAESRLFKNHPDHTYSLSGQLGYIIGIKPGMYLSTTYSISHEASLTTSDLFRAETVNSSLAEGGLSVLPSLADFERKFDPSNSYESHYDVDLHGINFDLSWNIKTLGMSWNINVPVNYRHQKLHYLRGSIDERIKRDKMFIGDISVNLNWNPSIGWIYMGIDRKVKSPDMVNMVDMTDALDPLNIMKGSPDLKDAEHLNARIYLSRYKSGISQNYGLDYNIIRNALAMGYNYNSVTGVRESRMYNVNGNWDIQATQRLTIPFGPMKRFSIGNSTRLYYKRSVDMIGEHNAGENISVTAPNKVNNYLVAEGLNIGYSDKRVRVGLSGDCNWNRYTSRQKGFEAFNAWNFRYGVNGNINLPANFSISTDFTVFNRRGYSDDALNTTNYVWNARLSYSAFKGRWLFMVDGFDILHSLKNISQTVNAQARTETWSNVLPRYLLFHVQWKFNKLPKKR